MSHPSSSCTRKGDAIMEWNIQSKAGPPSTKTCPSLRMPVNPENANAKQIFNHLLVCLHFESLYKSNIF